MRPAFDTFLFFKQLWHRNTSYSKHITKKLSCIRPLGNLAHKRYVWQNQIACATFLKMFLDEL